MTTLLVVHHGKGRGGAFLSLLYMLNEIKDKYDITIMCIYPSSASEYFVKEGFKVVYPESFFYKYYQLFIHSEASSHSVYYYLKKFYSFICFLLNKFVFARKELNKYDFSILYLNSAFLSDWAYSAHKSCKKVIMHVREPLAKSVSGRFLKGQYSRYVDKIIAISKDNAERLSQKEKTIVVYNPLIPKEKIYDCTRNKPISNFEENKRYFLYLGGDQSIKGFESLVSCLPFLSEDVIMLFCGKFKSPNLNKSRNLLYKICMLVKNLILNNVSIEKAYVKLYDSRNAIILDEINESDLQYLIKKCDAMVCPFSKPHFSRPILESYQYGIPVIASNVDGMQEIVDVNKTGLIYKSNKELISIINNNMINFCNKNDDCVKKLNYLYSNNVEISTIINSVK